MWRILDIGQDHRSLLVKNHQLVIKNNTASSKNILATLNFNDLHAIILHGHGIWLSRNVLDQAGEHNIPVIICNAQHIPQTITLPVVGHYHYQQRVHGQITITLARRKGLWKKIVQAKIKAQAYLLKSYQLPEADRLEAMLAKVLAGDANNHEAQAARIYWQALFGSDFRRNIEQPGLNAHLNYGYAILRASVARFIVASGLLPAIGLNHHNKLNPFCFVDDVMEPFRPLIDRLVRTHHKPFANRVTPENKAILSDIINHQLYYRDENISVQHAVQNLCHSFAQIFLGEEKNLALPPIIFTNQL